MKKTFRMGMIGLLLLITLSCNLPALQSSGVAKTPDTSVTFPPAAITPQPRPVTETASGNETSIPSIPQCAYSWATHSLPDESVRLKQAVEAAGLVGVTARAEAYGENCTSADGKVVSFSTMQTDFRFIDTATDTKDRGLMGKSVQALIGVVDSFPEGTFPGPQKGYIGVTFKEGGKEINLWFTRSEAQAALQEGLQGEALFKRLRHEE